MFNNFLLHSKIENTALNVRVPCKISPLEKQSSKIYCIRASGKILAIDIRFYGTKQVYES